MQRESQAWPNQRQSSSMQSGRYLLPPLRDHQVRRLLPATSLSKAMYFLPEPHMLNMLLKVEEVYFMQLNWFRSSERQDTPLNLGQVCSLQPSVLSKRSIEVSVHLQEQRRRLHHVLQWDHQPFEDRMWYGENTMPPVSARPNYWRSLIFSSRIQSSQMLYRPSCSARKAEKWQRIHDRTSCSDLKPAINVSMKQTQF